MASSLFDHGGRRPVEAAAKLVPFNSAYLARLSGYEPQQRTALLQRAATLNPYADQTWLQLGFDAEFHHADFAAAEKYYLKAADMSHLYLPRWTLTNFYFRRQDKPEFLKWAHAALQITPYSADPIFTELRLVDPGGQEIAPYIPNRPEILEQYLIFLMNAGQFASVPPVLDRLVASAPRSEAFLYGLSDVIGPDLDHLLASSYVTEALRMWNTLSKAQWIPFDTPDPARPLTNGSFANLFGHGFDWTLFASPGVSTTPPGAAHEIAIELSGDQPENCAILQQWVPVGPGMHYRLQWKFESRGFSGSSGLFWHLRGPNLNLTSPDLVSQTSSAWDFGTPLGLHNGLLTLEYSRPLGETKSSGSLSLQQVSLAPR